LRPHAESRDAIVRKLNENPFRPFSKNVDLLNPCDVQQILAKHLRFSGKETQRELAGFQGVHGKFNVGILVVQHRRQNPLRQLRCLVLNLFSALIELFGNLVGRRVVKKRDREKGKPGPRERIDVVVIFELLHALFERLRDQILHFLRGCSGPRGSHREYLDRERGILGPPER